MIDVMITGDSHTAALYKGQLAVQADGQWPDDIDLVIRPLGGGHLTREPFFVDRGDHAEMTAAEYRRQFERLPLAAGERSPSVYGVSAPLHSVRIWRHADWQSFTPHGAGLPGKPVSTAMVRRIALDDQRYVLELIGILLRTGKRVFVIEAPHPFRHHPALQGTRAELVLYLNRLYRDTIRSELAALGVPVVAVPERCIEGGFTRQDYAQPNDPHHGNPLYGRLMIEQVLDFLTTPAEPRGAELATAWAPA